MKETRRLGGFLVGKMRVREDICNTNDISLDTTIRLSALVSLCVAIILGTFTHGHARTHMSTQTHGP